MCDALKELMKDELEQSIEQGRQQGIEQGELIGKIKLLYQDFHMSVADIAQKLNVTPETVEEVLSSKQNSL